MNLWPLKPSLTCSHSYHNTFTVRTQVDLTVKIIIYWYILTCTCIVANFSKSTWGTNKTTPTNLVLLSNILMVARQHTLMVARQLILDLQ